MILRRCICPSIRSNNVLKYYVTVTLTLTFWPPKPNRFICTLNYIVNQSSVKFRLLNQSNVLWSFAAIEGSICRGGGVMGYNLCMKWLTPFPLPPQNHWTKRTGTQFLNTQLLVIYHSVDLSSRTNSRKKKKQIYKVIGSETHGFNAIKT